MSYCVNPVEEYVDSTCNETYAGGIRHMVIFLDALPTDPSSGSEILALIASNNARLVTNVKVGIPLPSEISVTRYISCSPATVANYDRTFTLMDDNVIDDTISFYNSLNATTGFEAVGVLLYHCDANRVSFIEDPISFSGGLVIPDDNNDLQHFEFTAKYKSKGDARIYATPSGVFPTS
jgi:hypothetical protein